MNAVRRSLAALLCLAGLAACGDSAPSKEAFLAKADPVCKAATTEATAMTTPTDLAALRQFHIRLAEGAERSVAELEKLKLPGGDDGKAARAWVGALREAAVAARAVAPEVEKSSYGTVETAARKAAESFKAADEQARSFGSRECGRGEAEATGRMLNALAKTVKSAYITTVDAMCKAAFAEYEKLDEPETLPQVKAMMEKIVAIDEKLVNDIKAVPAPVTDKDKLDAVFAALDKMLAKEREVVAAAASGKERETDDRWTESDAASLEVANKMDTYGFIECGSQSS